MNEKLDKVSREINRADSIPEYAATPRRSLADSKTWSGLLDSIENIIHSTQTVFKVSGKYLIESAQRVDPIFIYDNIILGMNGDRLVFLIGGKFEYVRNQLLAEAIRQEGYGLAKLVFGTCIAGYIFDVLNKKGEKTFSADEYCNLVQLTFKFELCRLNDAVSRWVCRFISCQASLEEAPNELRTTNFQFWENSHLSKDLLVHQGEKERLYSVGCFLENVLSG